jgi:hypothetical protein
VYETVISLFELKVVFDILDYRGAFFLYNLVERKDIQSFIEVFTSEQYLLNLLEAVHKQNIFPINYFTLFLLGLVFHSQAIFMEFLSCQFIVIY